MSLLDDFLRMFGTNRIQVRWRASRARDRVVGWWRRRGEPSKKGPRFEHQTCPQCAHPAAKDDKTCPKCGARLHGRTVQRLRRALGGLLPEGFPVWTTVLIAACIALYIVTVMKTYALVPGARGFKPIREVLERYGASATYLYGWWRGVTAIFLHADILHLVMNCLGIWVAGVAVEETFGRSRMIFLFVLTGVAGSVASDLWYAYRGQAVISVGASGAAFGLIGVMVGHGLRWKGRAGQEIRARFIPWAIFGVIVGFAMPRINNAAHIGGLLAGMAAGALLADRRRGRRVVPEVAWLALAALAVALVVVAFVMAAMTPGPRGPV